MADLTPRLQAIVRADPDLMRVLGLLRDMALPDGWLVSGAVYQTVWNVLTGRPRGTGIKDYDLVYFDAGDISWEAEDRIIRRAAVAAIGLPAPVEVRNQARVHLWFQARFGSPYPRLGSARESLNYYAAVVHAVAIRLDGGDGIEVTAPFGLDDMFAMVVRPNPAIANRAAYEAKAARALAIWPQLTVLPWGEG